MIYQCFRDPVSRGFILKRIGQLVHAEVRTMCSDRVKSVLQSNKCDDLKNFRWSRVMDEMKVHAPVLLSILVSCTKTKHPRSNQIATVCFVASVLFKFRYARMNVFQKVLSLILYAGHCGKQVCANINCSCIKSTHWFSRFMGGFKS